MSRAVVLEYSALAGSRWTKTFARWAAIALVVISAAAVGGGIAYCVQPRIFRATGIMNDHGYWGTGEPTEMIVARDIWRNRIQSDAFRLRLDAILRGSVSQLVDYGSATMHGMTKGVPSARIGTESVTAVPDSPNLLLIAAESTDPTTAAEAARLVGDVTLNEGLAVGPVWIVTPTIPTQPFNHVSYPAIGALCGGACAALILLAAALRKSPGRAGDLARRLRSRPVLR